MAHPPKYNHSRAAIAPRLSPRAVWGLRIEIHRCNDDGGSGLSSAGLRGSPFHRLLKDLAFLRRNRPVASWMTLRRTRVAAPSRDLTRTSLQ